MIEDGGQVLNVIQLVGTNIIKSCCRCRLQQGVGTVTGGLHGGIAGERFWHWTLVREVLDDIGCAFGASIWNVDPVALVVFGRGTDVPSVYTMRCPGAEIG